jgi:hypothetical protein
MTDHKLRAHSKFSASGSQRWLNCSASVELEEAAPPSPDSKWSREGTLAHEVLECLLKRKPLPDKFDVTSEMIAHCEKAANKIHALHKAFGGTLLVEKRVYATFIHPEMFGTVDAVIAANDGTLHIIDFKYGAGHIVDPVKNTQLIQYALSVAESYGWNEHFFTVKMWILQPRAGDDWHKSWTITMTELQGKWLYVWEQGVKRVLKGGGQPMPGSHCHWCRAKTTCPAKNETRVQKIANQFLNTPLERGIDGKEETEKSRVEEKSGDKEKARSQKSKQAFKKSFKKTFFGKPRVNAFGGKAFDA